MKYDKFLAEWRWEPALPGLVGQNCPSQELKIYLLLIAHSVLHISAVLSLNLYNTALAYFQTELHENGWKAGDLRCWTTAGAGPWWCDEERR